MREESASNVRLGDAETGSKASDMNTAFDKSTVAKLDNLVQAKHPGSICVVNYKGGVGKTTITPLLGYYLAKQSPSEKVLLFDIDPQCSLSLALGFDPDKLQHLQHPPEGAQGGGDQLEEGGGQMGAQLGQERVQLLGAEPDDFRSGRNL